MYLIVLSKKPTIAYMHIAKKIDGVFAHKKKYPGNSKPKKSNKPSNM